MFLASCGSPLFLVLPASFFLLTGDDISMYGGSVRDFCECSNMTTSFENAERGKVKGNEDLPATNTANHISRKYETLFCHSSGRWMVICSFFYCRLQFCGYVEEQQSETVLNVR